MKWWKSPGEHRKNSRKSCCDSLTFHILIVAVIAHFYSLFRESKWQCTRISHTGIWKMNRELKKINNEKLSETNTHKNEKIVSLVWCFSFDKIFHFYLSSSSFSLAIQSFHSFFFAFFCFFILFVVLKKFISIYNFSFCTFFFCFFFHNSIIKTLSSFFITFYAHIHTPHASSSITR